MEAPTYMPIELDSRPLERSELPSPNPLSEPGPGDASPTWGQEKGKGDRLQADEWMLAQADEPSAKQTGVKPQAQKSTERKDWNFFLKMSARHFSTEP